MSVYARISGGLIVETFTPPNAVPITSCFSPSLVWVEITDVSPAPQSGWTATQGGDGAWTFAAPAIPTPTLADQTKAFIAAGCSIVSAGTPAISRTYALDQGSLATVAEVVAGINAGDGFPGNATSFNYTDTLGTVEFPSTAAFLAVAKALRDFLYAALEVVYGRSTTLPAQPTNIS